MLQAERDGVSKTAAVLRQGLKGIKGWEWGTEVESDSIYFYDDVYGVLFYIAEDSSILLSQGIQIQDHLFQKQIL
jgi:hypothetical protein